jgi:hypothetical protein
MSMAMMVVGAVEYWNEYNGLPQPPLLAAKQIYDEDAAMAPVNSRSGVVSLPMIPTGAIPVMSFDIPAQRKQHNPTASLQT